MQTDALETLTQRYQLLAPHLDERQRRLWAGAEARLLGYGGISEVSRATGLARGVVAAGCRELIHPETGAPADRIRRPGGGRKRLEQLDPTLKEDLESLVEPLSRGEPDSPLRWTCKSTRQLAAALREQGYRIGHSRVAELLHELGYSLQANAKVLEGSDHPDRNAQFEHLNERVDSQMGEGQPVISVDAKKKEQIGPYKNAGQTWHPQGQPEAVNVYDFAQAKAIPYGIYDLSANSGWVNVGCDHDTAAFAVESIRRWWYSMGRDRYPQATQLLITADCGGSNSNRTRLWKWELQQLADQIGLKVEVCHLPPGTSKWNKIEHRLFAAISQNWRGRPLRSYQSVVQLIGSTRTRTGLSVQAELDSNLYPTGVSVDDEQMAQIQLQKDEFHGEWNYTISPSVTTNS